MSDLRRYPRFVTIEGGEGGDATVDLGSPAAEAIWVVAG